MLKYFLQEDQDFQSSPYPLKAKAKINFNSISIICMQIEKIQFITQVKKAILVDHIAMHVIDIMHVCKHEDR